MALLAVSPTVSADAVCDADPKNVNPLCGGDPFNLPIPAPLDVMTGEGNCDFTQPTIWEGGWWNDDCNSGTLGDVVSPDGSGLTERVLLHEEGIGVESQPLPPVGTGGVPVPDVPSQPGQAVPDVPGQPGQPVPDVPSQPGQSVPDHPGVGPVPTPGLGHDVGVLSTRDVDANYCVYFTPEGGSEQEVACVGRSFLWLVDQTLPREDRDLVFYDPADVPGTGPIVTPDVPPTGAVPTSDIPPTTPVVTPNVPPTSGQPTPDIPPVPVGSLGSSPEVTLDVDVSYSYDADRLAPLVSVLGHQTWSPVAAGDAGWLAWLASPTNPASLQVTVTLYKDGVSQGTVSHEIPALGQVLAAAEKSAGTL
jgi:hypothetical protein